MLLKLGLVALVTSSFYLGGMAIQEENTEYSADETASFIASNFSYFASMVRENVQNGASFSASYVENKIDIALTKTLEAAVYLDFDGENGYAVVGKNLEIYKVVVSGQLVFDLTRGDLVYSLYDGLGYSRTDVPFDPIGSGAVYDWTSAQNGTHYAGQETGAEGSGKIVRPSEYVTAKYGSGFENYEIRALPNWYFEIQKSFSLYAKRNEDGTTSYEGNCLLASLYKSLDYIRSSRGYSLPSDTVFSNLSNDSFYTSFMSQMTGDGHNRYSVYHTSCPHLYKEIRDYFRDNDSYTFESAHPSKAGDCIAAINTLNGTTFTSAMVTNWSFESEVESPITNINRYMIWNQVYGTYPNHSMPVVGYTLFRKTTGWWIFAHTDYVKLMEVNDNFIDQERYIDLNAYKNEDGGVGSFFAIVI